MIPEEILARPGRIICRPFPPVDGLDLVANLSPEACLHNQAAGKMSACARCRAGRRVRRRHPHRFQEIQAKLGPEQHPYRQYPQNQEYQRLRMAGERAADQARREGALQ